MKILFSSLALLVSMSVFAQKLATRTGYVRFFSHAPVEDIEAVNEQVSSIIDFESGSFAFLVPIKAFTFEKALMQEHFNENYLESAQFPTASFRGKIENLQYVKLDSDGTYEVTFTGSMNIHGIEQPFSTKASIIVKAGKVSLKSKFNIKPADYKISIPASKREHIADTIEVTVSMNYEKS